MSHGIHKALGLVMLWILVLDSGIVPAQQLTVSGYVFDGSSREILIGANVYDPQRLVGTSTNRFGYYTLTLPAADSVTLLFSYVGFQPAAKRIAARGSLRLDVHLTGTTALDEVSITAEPTRDIHETRMSVIDLPIEQIRQLPVLMGESDILKAIQLLPGVQQAQEGTTGFFVRGGNFDQNLVLLDDAPVYNPNHLFGLVSTFNINSVKHVELIKGGFPAQYGGRLSSVLDITMKDGNKERWQTEGGIGLLASNITVEGPIARSKASVLFSARRSYIDLIQKAFVRNNTTLYSFYDLNAKVHAEIGQRDKLYLSAFKGRDAGSYTGPNSLNYSIEFGNATATVRWSHLFGNNLFANASFIANDYELGLTTEQGSYYSLFYTGIRDLNYKADFTWVPRPTHTIRWGATYFYHTTAPSTFTDQIPINGNKVKIDRDLVVKRYANEMALYVNHEWELSSRWGLNYGLRVPYYYADEKKYLLFEPRFTLRWSVDDKTAIKAAYTDMNQFLHAIPYSTTSFPTDIWIASDAYVKPQHATQYSLGIFRMLKEGVYHASIEGYYKDMANQVLFKPGTKLDAESEISEEVTFGSGTSYGVEFMLHKDVGKLTGWLSYTWSKTTQIFPELNNGEPFPFTYDRRHSLAVVGMYAFNDHWSLSADFVFRTGSAYTLPPGRIPVTDGTLYDGWYYDYTTRNNARQRAYHRLDISVSYKKVRHLFGKAYESEWVFGAYNIYSRQNPYFIYVTVDPLTSKPQAREVSLLPIVPTVSFNFKF